MKKYRFPFYILLLVAVLFFAVYHLLPDDFFQDDVFIPPSDVHPTPSQSELSSANRDPGWTSKTEKDHFPDFRELWLRFFSGAIPNDYHSFAQHYKKLKELAKNSNPELVAGFIRDFLASNRDVAFNAPFQIGLDGQLVTPPTARTAALDILGDTDLDVVEEVSRQILDSPQSQDEYALALRNLAWMSDAENPDTDYSKDIATYFTKMLDTPEWISNPSGGFYEALDVGVEIGAAKDLESLILLPDAHPNLTRAAQIALDRVMLQKPESIIQAFEENPDFLSVSPTVRAQMFARVDVREPEQVRFLETYLKNPSISEKEKSDFIAIFPNANFHFGPRMVTENEDDMAMRSVDDKDAATMNFLKEKISNSSIDPQIRDYYSKMLKNLQRFYPDQN